MEENNNATDTNVGRIENSIEENIELLQDETSSLGLFFKCKGSEKYRIALEHILSDYKRLQEDFKQVDHECDRLEQKEIKLEKENAQLKEDIKEMYYKEAVITIICDNFDLSRNEVLELLGDEE